MSSSRVCVASFKLSRSVALSLLRRLSCDISFCSDVAMFVRVRIWFERVSSCCGDLAVAVEPLVTLARGLSVSRSRGESFGVDIVWSASIVADCGGVFSPRML